MQSRSQQNSQKNRVPRGVSLVEFVGCLAALGGGVVLGSIYLGVDVQTMAATIFEKADIDVPAILNATSEANKPETTQESLEGETSEEWIAVEALPTVADESVAGQEVADPGANLVASGETASDESELIELTDAEKLAATQKCWLELNECIQTEVSNRSSGMNESQSWQLYDYLLHRNEGHQQVVEAIERLDHQGVDPRLRAYAQQVLAWHRSGANLFDRAAQLLTDAPAGNLTGPFAQSWQSAATQHRMEEKLILNKHVAVASYLEHVKKASAVTVESN